MSRVVLFVVAWLAGLALSGCCSMSGGVPRQGDIDRLVNVRNQTIRVGSHLRYVEREVSLIHDQELRERRRSDVELLASSYSATGAELERSAMLLAQWLEGSDYRDVCAEFAKLGKRLDADRALLEDHVRHLNVAVQQDRIAGKSGAVEMFLLVSKIGTSLSDAIEQFRQDRWEASVLERARVATWLRSEMLLPDYDSLTAVSPTSATENQYAIVDYK